MSFRIFCYRSVESALSRLPFLFEPVTLAPDVDDRTPFGGVTGFGYDANGNLLTVTDARNNTTTYTYNNMDRLATRTDPLLRAESYVYDGNGNPTQFTDRKQQPTNSTYDGLNRLTGVTYADGSTTTYTYDAGNGLTQIVDSVSGTITRAYDGLDRLTSESTPQGSVSYTYDAAGRRTSMTVFGQPSVGYTYDNADRLIQISQGSSSVTFTYDNSNRRSSLTLPNGILTEYAYDAASRVTGITYKQGTNTWGNLTYEYDIAGNRTKVGGSFARTGVPQAVSSTAYNAANHQTTFGDKTLTYDNNGNLSSIVDAAGTTLYTWNARNQLTGISGPGVNASFAYDGLGRREKKTINTSLTELLYDGVNPVQETSGAAVLANILTGLDVDEFLTRTDVPAGVTSSFLRDGLGSALALADSAGAVQTEYTYEPFGRTTLTGDANTSSYQYTGRENDGTGLNYYRARYYHPGLQRFISEDPIEFESGDTNLYAYVWNNPINYTDPSGEFVIPLVASCAAGAAMDVGMAFAAGALSGRKPTPEEVGNAAAKGCLAGGLGFGLGKALNAIVSGKLGTTTLWRAVKPAELADIQTHGIFRNLGSAEGKYFSTTAEGAASYAKQAVKAFGDPPYTLVKTKIPNRLLPPSITMDRNVPGVVIPNNVLPNLKPQILDYFPIPR